MSAVTDLHAAVKRGDLEAIRALLKGDARLANARSETDPRGTYPLHVAAEFGQAGAAKLLLAHGADFSRLDLENDAIALSWAAFFGRPEVTKLLLEAGSDRQQRNKHGLTPLDCALGGAQGQWQRFSNASLEDWRRCVELLQRS
jgi:ankyrin repeat protein